MNFNLEEFKANYKKERAEKIKGLTDEEIREMDFLEELEDLNNAPGDLTGYDCVICKNRGYIRRRFKDEVYKYSSYVQDCECLTIRRRKEQIERSGLAVVIKEKTFDSFQTNQKWETELKNLALNYYKKMPPNWFMFCGQSGIGKTHLCTAIVGNLLNDGIDVIYLPYREEIPRLKRLSLDNNEYSFKMSEWQNCTVLYIDDLYKGKLTEADPSIIFEIIDYRDKNKKRTIISTEKTIDELLAIDEAVAGRIIKRCGEWFSDIPKDAKKNYRLKNIT